MDITKLTKAQLQYCAKTCPKGSTKRKELLENCESACDAAADMWAFVSECSENCNILKTWEATTHGENS